MNGQDAEREWIVRAGEGDGDAFARLVESHQRMVFRVCLAALGDPQAADEAAQDVFVRLHDKLGTFRGDSRLGTWLYRVALNICADRRRGSVWRRWLGLDAARNHVSPDRPDVDAEQREAAGQLAAALNRLPRDFREILILRELEEREYAEIAAILGVALGTVESRLHRARRKLKEIMLEE